MSLLLYKNCEIEYNFTKKEPSNGIYYDDVELLSVKRDGVDILDVLDDLDNKAKYDLVKTIEDKILDLGR